MPQRIPNKLQWGLDDILSASATARRSYDVIRGAVLRRNDPDLLRALLQLQESLAEIDRKARNARNGVYEE